MFALSVNNPPHLRALVVSSGTLLAVYLLSHLFTRRRSRNTLLLGPTTPSWLLGHKKTFDAAPDFTSVHSTWFEQYGSAFLLQMPLGTQHIMVGDPRALAHIYARDTYGYVQGTLLKILLERMVRL
jgi:hypothetical protein